ncbi:MAG: carboxypeptidase-like regulatory domain-containing protein, partial [Myxococcota bacterium]
GWELLGIADRTFGPVTVAANVGTRGVPRAEYDDLVWNDQVFGRIGGGWRLTEDVGASAELAAQTNWSSGQNPAGSAVEAMGGGWAWLADGIVARGGLGIGLTRAPGAPAMRLVVGVSYEPNPTPDRDHDGLANKADRCPSDPEDPDDYADADGCPDPSYTTEIRLVGRDGATVDGSVTLAGPQSVSLDPGDRFVAVHPGTYAVTAAIPGYERYTGEIVVPARQGERFALTLVADDGALRVWAVDPAGNPVPAAVLRVSGGEAQPADGDAIPLPPGEHAVVVTADGFTAAAASVAITGGETRELSVVLVPTPPGPAPQPVSAPGG